MLKSFQIFPTFVIGVGCGWAYLEFSLPSLYFRLKAGAAYQSFVIFAFSSLYGWGMRDLSPAEVLAVIARRLEKRAKALEGVRMREYDMTAKELRDFAAMVKRAQEYVRHKQFGRH